MDGHLRISRIAYGNEIFAADRIICWTCQNSDPIGGQMIRQGGKTEDDGKVMLHDELVGLEAKNR